MRKAKPAIILFTLVILIGFFMLAACSQHVNVTPTATAIVIPSATPTVTPISRLPTPTPAILGSLENPVGMGTVARDGDAEISNSSSMLADELTTYSQVTIRSNLYTSYDDLLNGLQNGEIQFAWLPPVTYIVAHNRGLVDANLVTNHFGVYSYSFQILANVNSGFTAYYDPNTNHSPVDALTALAQLQEKRPCWVDFLSPSGYLAPLGTFEQAGIPILDGVFTRSHTSVIRALYATGICDFGATYSTYSDPRTDATLNQEYPDLMQKIVIIWQSEPIIPNLGVAFSQDLDPDLRIAIANGLVKYAATEDGLQTLSTANNYDISGFKTVDDSDYDALRILIESSGIKLIDMIGS